MNRKSNTVYHMNQRNTLKISARTTIILCGFWLLVCIPFVNAQDVKIFSNNNIAAVYNLKTTSFQLSAPMFITKITTYHWNDRKGTPPGKIGIRGVGLWNAQGSPGMYNTPNAYWNVYPNIRLEAGTYYITDSDPATWSQNSGSNGLGFVEVFGRSPGQISSIPVSNPTPAPVTNIPQQVNTPLVQGTYSTDYRNLTLTQTNNSITGHYESGNGTLNGLLNGNRLTGTWYNSGSKKNGTFEFIFNSNFTAFTGKYGYKQAAPYKKWNGTKIR